MGSGCGFTCLCKHEALGSIPISCRNWVWEYTPIVSAPGKWRKENHKFKVIFDYVVSLRPSWAPRDIEAKVIRPGLSETKVIRKGPFRGASPAPSL